jgi:hypothetical protein
LQCAPGHTLHWDAEEAAPRAARALSLKHTHDSSVLTCCLCLSASSPSPHARCFASAACPWLRKFEGGTSSSMSTLLASVESRRTVTVPPARHARSTARGRNHAARHDRCVCRQRCHSASSLTAFRPLLLRALRPSLPRLAAGTGRYAPQPKFQPFNFYSCVRVGDPEQLKLVRCPWEAGACTPPLGSEQATVRALSDHGHRPLLLVPRQRRRGARPLCGDVQAAGHGALRGQATRHPLNSHCASLRPVCSRARTRCTPVTSDCYLPVR